MMETSQWGLRPTSNIFIDKKRKTFAERSSSHRSTNARVHSYTVKYAWGRTLAHNKPWSKLLKKQLVPGFICENQVDYRMRGLQRVVKERGENIASTALSCEDCATICGKKRKIIKTGGCVIGKDRDIRYLFNPYIKYIEECKWAVIAK